MFLLLPVPQRRVMLDRRSQRTAEVVGIEIRRVHPCDPRDELAASRAKSVHPSAGGSAHAGVDAGVDLKQKPLRPRPDAADRHGRVGPACRAGHAEQLSRPPPKQFALSRKRPPAPRVPAVDPGRPAVMRLVVVALAAERQAVLHRPGQLRTSHHVADVVNVQVDRRSAPAAAVVIAGQHGRPPGPVTEKCRRSVHAYSIAAEPAVE